MLTIAELVGRAHGTALKKGWWDQQPERSFPEQVALMHSELSEALEDYRVVGLIGPHLHYGAADGKLVTEQLYVGDGELRTPCHKPQGLASELADVLIRIADTCGRYGIPLEEAIQRKLEYNEHRPHRHGGKLC